MAEAIVAVWLSAQEVDLKHAESASKITPRHLERKAVAYLRQSSIAQVKHNTAEPAGAVRLEGHCKGLRLCTG